MKIIDDILYEMQEYLNQEVIDTDKETISDVAAAMLLPYFYDFYY